MSPQEVPAHQRRGEDRMEANEESGLCRDRPFVKRDGARKPREPCHPGQAGARCTVPLLLPAFSARLSLPLRAPCR